MPCLLLVLTIGLLLPACKSDADKYDEALTLMLEQDYERAAGILDGIMNYKDSAAQKAECDHYILYNAGLEDIAAEKYETAQVKFKALSEAGFLDSGRLLEDCKNNISYNEALSMMEQGDADSAMNSFLTLGNFKDSKTRVIECQNLKRYSDRRGADARGRRFNRHGCF